STAAGSTVRAGYGLNGVIAGAGCGGCEPAFDAMTALAVAMIIVNVCRAVRVIVIVVLRSRRRPRAPGDRLAADRDVAARRCACPVYRRTAADSGAARANASGRCRLGTRRSASV